MGIDELAEESADALASVIAIVEAATIHGVPFPDFDVYDEPPSTLGEWAERVSRDVAITRRYARPSPDIRLVMMDQFWSIGGQISEQISAGNDLQSVLDALEGALGDHASSLAFNRDNLEHMYRFYVTWPARLAWHYLTALPWGQIRLILDAHISRKQRDEIAREAIEGDWLDTELEEALAKAEAALPQNTLKPVNDASSW